MKTNKLNAYKASLQGSQKDLSIEQNSQQLVLILDVYHIDRHLQLNYLYKCLEHNSSHCK